MIIEYNSFFFTLSSFSESSCGGTRMPESLKVKRFFLMRSLMKVTTKKSDKTMHSFYFKLPRLERLVSHYWLDFYRLVSSFSVEILADVAFQSS